MRRPQQGPFSWKNDGEGPASPFFVPDCRWRVLYTEKVLSSVKLTNLLRPLVEDLGYEFVGLEQRRDPKNPVLVVYIDKPDGIAVEDCEKVSREVAALLDVEDPIPGRYSLEVSSPGLDRPLFTAAHFEQFRGEMAQVSMYAPIEGRRKFKGKILGADQDQLQLDVDGVEIMLAMTDIARARLAPDYDNLFAKREEAR
jgi:ribosome maturation factor RimP